MSLAIAMEAGACENPNLCSRRLRPIAKLLFACVAVTMSDRGAVARVVVPPVSLLCQKREINRVRQAGVENFDGRLLRICQHVVLAMMRFHVDARRCSYLITLSSQTRSASSSMPLMTTRRTISEFDAWQIVILENRIALVQAAPTRTDRRSRRNTTLSATIGLDALIDHSVATSLAADDYNFGGVAEGIYTLAGADITRASAWSRDGQAEARNRLASLLATPSVVLTLESSRSNSPKFAPSISAITSNAASVL
jgi:hypothetical protein